MFVFKEDRRLAVSSCSPTGTKSDLKSEGADTRHHMPGSLIRLLLFPMYFSSQEEDEKVAVSFCSIDRGVWSSSPQSIGAWMKKLCHGERDWNGRSEKIMMWYGCFFLINLAFRFKCRPKPLGEQFETIMKNGCFFSALLFFQTFLTKAKEILKFLVIKCQQILPWFSKTFSGLK